MRNFGARIHVLLARDVPTAVVIRRGPSKRVATLLWNRETDEFQLGQWLKGRIYARRCDLSPDGTYFLYFAMNGKWDSETGGSWTAISRAPYLKALALFPKGDCWHGGGLWTGYRTYWLNDGYGHTVLRNTPAVKRDHEWRPPVYFNAECLGVYYVRLMRDGWQLKTAAGELTKGAVFEKPCPNGWTLRKLAHIGSAPGRGCYWDGHELFHASSGKSMPFPNWEWAELDGGRLVWASDGKLEAGRLCADGLVDRKLLCCFNAMEFEAVKAPY